MVSSKKKTASLTALFGFGPDSLPSLVRTSTKKRSNWRRGERTPESLRTFSVLVSATTPACSALSSWAVLGRESRGSWKSDGGVECRFQQRQEGVRHGGGQEERGREGLTTGMKLSKEDFFSPLVTLLSHFAPGPPILDCGSPPFYDGKASEAQTSRALWKFVHFS